MSVGVSLLAMAVGQSPAMLAGPTPSLASQLPQGFEVYTGFINIHRVCRSEPARDAGGSVTKMLAGPTPSLASQLPQGFEVYTGFINIHRCL
jgi:hypothetical protein